MKWMNVLTDVSDEDREFNEIIYELFSSKADHDRYVVSTDKIKELHGQESKIFEDGMKALSRYAKKVKKPMEEIVSYVPDEKGAMHVNAIDPKMKANADTVSTAWAKLRILDNLLDSTYTLADEDFEILPELKDFPMPQDRLVYSVPFSAKTTWKKLGVPAELRHSFVAALAMSRMSEEIV